jgi:hypothetical protein
MASQTFVHLFGEFTQQTWVWSSLIKTATGQQEAAEAAMDEAADVSETYLYWAKVTDYLAGGNTTGHQGGPSR